jgi:hypothetical protein
MKELVLIQTELRAPKNQFNAFGKYKYRSCEDIVEAVKPILAKYECFLNISDTIQEVGGYVFVHATATVVNSEGKAVFSTAQAGIEQGKGMSIAQAFGSSSSYARKYALNGLFAIDDTKDADSTNQHGKEEEPKLSKEDFQTWSDTLGQVSTNEELIRLYGDNRTIVDKYVEVKNLFSKRKKELK